MASKRRLRREYERNPLRCHYCQRVLTIKAITRDHIVPKAAGGRNATYNYVASCGPCNLAKADRMPNCTCPKCLAAVRIWGQLYA
jgi:5-methylcytosine-specific restriction endonuclease McrA